MSVKGLTALSDQMRGWMLVTATVTVVPHLPFVHSWLGAFACLTLIWQGWTLYKHGPPPNRWLITALAIGSGGGVLLGYQTLLGKQAGIALLVTLLSLKLLESRTRRDVSVFIFLAFFLQLGLFLDTESALTAVGALIGAWSATVTLLNTVGETRSKRAMRTSALLLLQSIPFMLVMFVLFPRIPGPLWGLPKDAFSGTTGLSESMAPGSISSLVQSGQVAFRARFKGTPPRADQRYWRGPVLTDFDGRRWTPHKAAVRETPAYPVRGPRLDYTMVLEPHNKPWLLALDYAAPGVKGAVYAADFELLHTSPVQQRLRFDAASYPEAIVGMDEHEESLKAALTLPPASNPRTAALAKQLRTRARSDEAILSAALSWLRQANLSYTLDPPPLGRHTADEFLFDTRQGFCEHFASSFTILMRAAGLPARVVTGYQGGELNPYDQFLVIRQSDAHAWTEVWLKKRGWIRVDPTAAAYPVRIDGGAMSALSRDAAAPLMLRPDLGWLRDLRQRWDFVNNTWNQWILGYDQARQRNLLTRLGLDATNWAQLALLMMTLSLIFVVAMLWWSHRRTTVSDPVLRQWRRFEHRLSRKGVPRLPREGPADYAARAGEAFDAQRALITAIARTYARLHYGREQAAGPDVAELKSMIDRLKL